MKRENRKLNHHLKEVTGLRTELKDYLGDELRVNVFVTNTLGYKGNKRLIQEVYINDLYLKHIWLKTENVGNLQHGYQTLKVKVVDYKDQVTNEVKYGLLYIGTKGKQYTDNTLKKPKWMNV